MKGPGMPFLRAAFLLLLMSALAGCGYNTLQKQDEQVTSAWWEVLNQYQRRADLVPYLGLIGLALFGADDLLFSLGGNDQGSLLC